MAAAAATWPIFRAPAPPGAYLPASALPATCSALPTAAVLPALAPLRCYPLPTVEAGVAVGLAVQCHFGRVSVGYAFARPGYYPGCMRFGRYACWGWATLVLLPCLPPLLLQALVRLPSPYVCHLNTRVVCVSSPLFT